LLKLLSKESIMFEQASRLRLRFTTPVGLVSVEDLWDLKLTTLDTVAVTLHKALSDSNLSFISENKVDPTLKLKFDIVKHVIETRIKEREHEKEIFEKNAKKQQLLEILSRKQNAELESKSPEELKALINSL